MTTAPIPSIQPGQPILGEPEAPLWSRLAASASIYAIYLLLLYIVSDRHWIAAPFMPAGALSWITFALVCFGLVTIVVDSAIMKPFRELAGRIPVAGKHLYEMQDGEGVDGLLACSLCTSFWIGTLVAAIGFTAFPVSSVDVLHTMRDLAGHGLLGAGTGWILHLTAAKLGAYG